VSEGEGEGGRGKGEGEVEEKKEYGRGRWDPSRASPAQCDPSLDSSVTWRWRKNFSVHFEAKRRL